MKQYFKVARNEEYFIVANNDWSKTQRIFNESLDYIM